MVLVQHASSEGSTPLVITFYPYEFALAPFLLQVKTSLLAAVSSARGGGWAGFYPNAGGHHKLLRALIPLEEGRTRSHPVWGLGWGSIVVVSSARKTKRSLRLFLVLNCVKLG